LIERTGKKSDIYLIEVRNFIAQHFNSTNLLAGLGELIDEKQKSRVKSHLVMDTI
jgi:hypothetical protein